MANWRGSRTIKNASILEKHLGRHRNSAEAMIGQKLEIIDCTNHTSTSDHTKSVVSIINMNNHDPQNTPPTNGKYLNICDISAIGDTARLGNTGIQILKLSPVNKVVLSTILRGLCRNSENINNLDFTKWGALSVQQSKINSDKQHQSFLKSVRSKQNLPKTTFGHLAKFFQECIKKSTITHTIKTDGQFCQHNIKFDGDQELASLIKTASKAEDCVIGFNQCEGKVSEIVLIYSVNLETSDLNTAGPIAIFFYKPNFGTEECIKEAG